MGEFITFIGWLLYIQFLIIWWPIKGLYLLVKWIFRAQATAKARNEEAVANERFGRDQELAPRIPTASTTNTLFGKEPEPEREVLQITFQPKQITYQPENPRDEVPKDSTPDFIAFIKQKFDEFMRKRANAGQKQ